MHVFILLSIVCGQSFHPLSGHFTAEHYNIVDNSYETYSYYGWMNWFTLNVGYHNEHHDFPKVPHDKLKSLHKALYANSSRKYGIIPSWFWDGQQNLY